MQTVPKPAYPIQMVDLQRQYLSIQGELDAVIHLVLQSGRFVKGPEIKTFEHNLAAYLQIPHVVSCANGTDALQMALMALDLQPGDEVITADFTFIASAEVIAMLGLTPVLVDVCSDTFCIDPAAVEAAITSRTKAIIPVHLFGQVADMEALLTLAEKHGLFVIEDAAQAIGAQYGFSSGKTAYAGGMGHLGTTSFFPSKNLGCFGDGGALFTHDTSLAERLRMLANHGQSAHYVHDIIGLNSRLDTLQAAILDVKLRHLNDFNWKRRQVAAAYSEALSGIPEITTPYTAPNSTHVFHQYTLKVEASLRDALKHYLSEQNIPTAIYYTTPLHRQNALAKYSKTHMDFENANALATQVLSLPICPELDPEQMAYITHHIKHFIQHKS